MTDEGIEAERRLVYGRAARRLADAAATWASQSTKPLTLADILAAIDSFKAPGPAGWGRPEPLMAAEIRARSAR